MLVGVLVSAVISSVCTGPVFVQPSFSFIPNALLNHRHLCFLYCHSRIVIVFSNLGLLCGFLKKYVPMFCILLKDILEIG